MESNRFNIIFEKIKAAKEEPSATEGPFNDFEAIKLEADEIAELRQIVLETVETPPKFYTTT